MTRNRMKMWAPALAALILLVVASFAVAQEKGKDNNQDADEGSYYEEEQAGGIAYDEQEVTLDKETILGVVKKQYPAITACYEKVLQSERTLRGRLVIEWMIKLDGYVKDVKVSEGTTLKNKDVQKCVIDKVKGFRFPARKAGEDIPVRFPFKFEPKAEQ